MGVVCFAGTRTRSVYEDRLDWTGIKKHKKVQLPIAQNAFGISGQTCHVAIRWRQ